MNIMFFHNCLTRGGSFHLVVGGRPVALRQKRSAVSTNLSVFSRSLSLPAPHQLHPVSSQLFIVPGQPLFFLRNGATEDRILRCGAGGSHRFYGRAWIAHLRPAGGRKSTRWYHVEFRELYIFSNLFCCASCISSRSISSTWYIPKAANDSRNKRHEARSLVEARAFVDEQREFVALSLCRTSWLKFRRCFSRSLFPGVLK